MNNVEKRRAQFEKCAKANKVRSRALGAGTAIINDAELISYDENSEDVAIMELQNRQAIVCKAVN